MVPSSMDKPNLGMGTNLTFASAAAFAGSAGAAGAASGAGAGAGAASPPRRALISSPASPMMAMGVPHSTVSSTSTRILRRVPSNSDSALLVSFSEFTSAIACPLEM